MRIAVEHAEIHFDYRNEARDEVIAGLFDGLKPERQENERITDYDE